MLSKDLCCKQTTTYSVLVPQYEAYDIFFRLDNL